MKAVQFRQPGEPREVLEVVERDKPVPGFGQVLVRMLASPVNPSDLAFTRGGYGLKPQLPATPGFEGVGVVESTGGGPLPWLRKGKRVAVINDRTGNWQEYVVVAARQVVPVPSGFTDAQAATFFVNPATAYVMTQKVLKLQRGEWLLQSAAGSALGLMVIRLAKKYGFRTINVVRAPHAIDALKKAGADEVICTESESIVDRVMAITNGAGVRCAIDPVGGETGTRVVAATGIHGHTLLFGMLSGQPVTVDPRGMISGAKRVEGFWLSDWAKQQSVFGMLGLFRQVRKLVADGTLDTEVAATYPLDKVHEAVEHAERNARGGKVLLRIDGERK